MNVIKIGCFGLAASLSLLVGCTPAHAATQKDVSSNKEEKTVTTNENGVVSQVITISTVTTNGNLVTERRRETRTDRDAKDNLIETSTSEYTQSYTVGDKPLSTLDEEQDGEPEADVDAPVVTDNFMGFKFGDILGETNTVREAGEPSLLRVKITPKKPLEGFDDYYAYLTPKTHKIAKVVACAKEPVEPIYGGSWRNHYLVEALENRYRTRARPISFSRPYFALDVAAGRKVTVCLAAASHQYQTVVSAWDNGVVNEADREEQELRQEARKKAREARARQVTRAQDAF